MNPYMIALDAIRKSGLWIVVAVAAFAGAYQAHFKYANLEMTIGLSAIGIFCTVVRVYLWVGERNIMKTKGEITRLEALKDAGIVAEKYLNTPENFLDTLKNLELAIYRLKAGQDRNKVFETYKYTIAYIERVIEAASQDEEKAAEKALNATT